MSSGAVGTQAMAGGYGPPPGGYGAPGGGIGPGGYGPPPGPGGYGPPGGGYGAPPGGYGQGPGPGYGGRAEAEAKVKTPAILMLICTIVGILVQIFGLVANLIGAGMTAANDGSVETLMSGAVGVLMNAVGIIAGAFCIFGFTKMMKLENRGLTYAAVILSMIPCLGSCWCLNIFFGIWALMTLSDHNVRTEFR